MNIATLNTALRAAITAYADTLNTWAQAAYTKNHNFIDRKDVRNAPIADNCPCCLLTPDTKEMSHESPIHFNNFLLDVIVEDESSSGFANLEAYRVHLQTCIETYARSQGLAMVGIIVDYDLDSSYPMLWCGMQIKFKQHKTIGQNPIT